MSPVSRARLRPGRPVSRITASAKTGAADRTLLGGPTNPVRAAIAARIAADAAVPVVVAQAGVDWSPDEDELHRDIMAAVWRWYADDEREDVAPG